MNMFTKIVAATAMTLATLGATGIAQAEGAQKHIINYNDLPWETVAEGAEAVILWGSEENGDAVWGFRMQPGVEFPLHAHTNDYYGLALQGNWTHIDADGHEVTTAQEAFSFIKGGEFHGDRCEGPEVCITLVDLDGARDLYFPQQ